MSKAIIFDFDGTLVNSEKAIYKCFEKITYKIAPQRIQYAKNILIGPPLRETVSKILGSKNQDRIDEFVNLFIKIHDEQVINHTQPYPHVNEILKKLNDKNILMGIATNKRHAPTIKLIEHLGWAHYFCSLECNDSRPNTRNKSEMIQDIFSLNNIFKNGYFIGDTVNDGLSANRNNLKFIKANFGYGKNQDWSKVNITRTINSFVEINSIIL